MNLTEDQARNLAEKVKIKKPCINCGYDGHFNTAIELVEQTSFIPNTKTGSEEKKTTLLLATCPKCGFTTSINLNVLNIV